MVIKKKYLGYIAEAKETVEMRESLAERERGRVRGFKDDFGFFR